MQGTENAVLNLFSVIIVFIYFGVTFAIRTEKT